MFAKALTRTCFFTLSFVEPSTTCTCSICCLLCIYYLSHLCCIASGRSALGRRQHLSCNAGQANLNQNDFALYQHYLYAHTCTCATLKPHCYMYVMQPCLLRPAEGSAYMYICAVRALCACTYIYYIFSTHVIHVSVKWMLSSIVVACIIYKHVAFMYHDIIVVQCVCMDCSNCAMLYVNDDSIKGSEVHERKTHATPATHLTIPRHTTPHHITPH